jgi:hypothetical protein
MLVIADRNLVEIAGDLRGDRGVVGLHIGVVGRHLEAPHRPVIPAIPGCGGEQGCGRAGDQGLADAVSFRGCCGLDGGVRRRNQFLSGFSSGFLGSFLGSFGRNFGDGLESSGLGAHGGPP